MISVSIKSVRGGDVVTWNGRKYKVVEVDYGDDTVLCDSGSAGSEPIWIAWSNITSHEPVRESSDVVNHPPHYTQHPSGVECIAITEAFNFNIGNAIKYLWRAGPKGDAIEDLRKAAWYVQREIERRERETLKGGDT